MLKIKLLLIFAFFYANSALSLKCEGVMAYSGSHGDPFQTRINRAHNLIRRNGNNVRALRSLSLVYLERYNAESHLEDAINSFFFHSRIRKRIHLSEAEMSSSKAQILSYIVTMESVLVNGGKDLIETPLRDEILDLIGNYVDTQFIFQRDLAYLDEAIKANEALVRKLLGSSHLVHSSVAALLSLIRKYRAAKYAFETAMSALDKYPFREHKSLFNSLSFFEERDLDALLAFLSGQPHLNYERLDPLLRAYLINELGDLIQIKMREQDFETAATIRDLIKKISDTAS